MVLKIPLQHMLFRGLLEILCPHCCFVLCALRTSMLAYMLFRVEFTKQQKMLSEIPCKHMLLRVKLTTCNKIC